MSIWTESLPNLDNVDLEDETDDSDELDETDNEDEDDESWREETKKVNVTVTGTYQVYGSDYDTREEWDNLLQTEQQAYDNNDMDITDVAYAMEDETVTVNSVTFVENE